MSMPGLAGADSYETVAMSTNGNPAR